MIETIAKSAAFEVKPKETAPSPADIYKVSDSKHPPWRAPSETKKNQTEDIPITFSSSDSGTYLQEEITQ